MQYTVFDIETTGFSPSSDAVVQFAYIVCNENLFPIRGRNYYLFKRGMRWSKEAEAVHGLSQEFLSQYEDQYNENVIHMYQVLHRAILIGHNSDHFDIPFVQQFLTREGLGSPKPESSYDTMKLWTKPYGKKPKLGALPEFLGLQEDKIIQMASLVYGKDAGDLRAHNACYDTALTLACFKAAVDKGLCTLATEDASSDLTPLY